MRGLSKRRSQSYPGSSRSLASICTVSCSHAAGARIRSSRTGKSALTIFSSATTALSTIRHWSSSSIWTGWWCDSSYETFLWLGFKVKGSSIDVVADAYGGVIWPNFAIGLFPSEGFAHTNLFVADGIEHSIQHRAYCFADKVSDELAQENMDFMDQVVSEDQPLCAKVQQGVRSGFFGQGYVMDKNNERSVGAFHRYLARELTNCGSG